MPIDTESRVITRTVEALKQGVPYILHQGGTSSGKTYGILYSILFYALRYLRPRANIAIMSENLPHLKRGAIADFENILFETGIEGNLEDGQDGPVEINQQNHIYTIPNDIKFHFIYPDTEAKAKAGRWDILFINEANAVKWAIAKQLIRRTSGPKIFDWNPSGTYWLNRNLFKTLKEGDYIFSRTTYRDNKSISQGIIDEIERIKLFDETDYQIYGMGIEGKGSEIIFPNFTLVDSFPETRNVSTGLDFGFTNHPSASVRCALQNGCLWFDEIFYKKGLSNKKLFDIYDAIPYDYGTIIADSAEPKSIKELFDFGLNIKPAFKGADSVKYGIQQIKSFPINVTKRSENLIEELEGYKWIMIDGIPTDRPVDKFNHLMDAMRYGVQGILNRPEPIKMQVKKAASFGFTDMGI